jgi:phage gp36-like protein
MSYVTEQDLKDELGQDKLIQLSATDEAPDEIGAGRINKAISYAQGLFDSFARTRYEIPVPVTQMVRSICLDLAVFHLFKSRSQVKEGAYEIRKDSHDSALRLLQAIQSGKAALDVPSAEETAETPASPDEVLKASDVKSAVFSDDKLGGF